MTIETKTPVTLNYQPSHPWYYVLGGTPLRPKQILANTHTENYNGYLERDIKAIDRMAEPKRSEKLRALRKDCMKSLRFDLSRYRECMRILRRYNKDNSGKTESSCEDIHVSLSLKHNHICNDFGHFIFIDSLLAKQPDLFELV